MASEPVAEMGVAIDSHLRFLLLQARLPDDEMAAHEHQCFTRALGAEPAQVLGHSLLAGRPDPGLLESADALLVGGSGQFSVLDDEPWVKDFIDFLSEVVVGQRRPTFASCFGFQGLVLAGGGEVICDKEGAEVGTFSLSLSTAGLADPLFGKMPQGCNVQLGHKDRAERLPAGMIHMAYTERSAHQALRIEGTPIVATQFHPELAKQDNINRYLRYWEEYGSGDPGCDPVMQSMAESPEAYELLPRWAETELG
jgi:GMP synthase (glutamine-hydrolysing)